MQTSTNTSDYLEKKTTLVNDHLDRLITEEDVPQNRLYQAARYSLLGKGKKIRPILTLATAESFGVDPNDALNAACAIEMIHTYSLIHDDLPCMDDDDYRRGKPSLHKAFPEGHAILTGDLLLTKAFEVITADNHLSADQKVKLCTVLSKKSGGEGMIGGQIIDIEAEGKSINLETLQNIHLNKTGALIAASLMFGGIIADCPEEQLQALEKFGEKIGLAYQIIDDVLDVTSSLEKLGKTIGSDSNNHKTTYVSIMGVKQAEIAAHSLLSAGLKELKEIPFDPILLQLLANSLIVRES